MLKFHLFSLKFLPFWSIIKQDHVTDKCVGLNSKIKLQLKPFLQEN